PAFSGLLPLHGTSPPGHELFLACQALAPRAQYRKQVVWKGNNEHGGAEWPSGSPSKRPGTAAPGTAHAAHTPESHFQQATAPFAAVRSLLLTHSRATGSWRKTDSAFRTDRNRASLPRKCLAEGLRMVKQSLRPLFPTGWRPTEHPAALFPPRK